MSEKLDIYNYKRIKTGKIIERQENVILDKCDYILAIQCWIINAKGEILLTRRKLGKVHGGMWEPTGGLVQSGENSIQATQRELNEEIGINIFREDMKILHIYHNFRNDMLKFVFSVNKYEGNLINNEPEKCKELKWFEVEKLPENIIPKIREEILNVENSVLYNYDE